MRYRIGTAFVLALTLACSGGTDTTSGVTSITLTYTSPTLALGDVQTMGPVYRGADGTAIGTVNGAKWTSSNSAVASVDQTGQVTGLSLGGPVTITVKLGSTTATTALSVVPDRIAVSPVIASVGIGNTVQLTGSPLNVSGGTIPGSAAPVTWSSNNQSVATVGASTGALTGVSAGFARITATAAGQSSGFDIEVGAISPFDGSWTGNTVAGSRAIAMVVLFGTVRSFRLTYHLFPIPYSPTCTRLVEAIGSPNASITNTQFSFNLFSPPTTVVNGTFTTSTEVNGSLTTTSLGTYSCNLLENGASTPQVTYVATIPATAWTASKL